MKKGWKMKTLAVVNAVLRKIGVEIVSAHMGAGKWQRAVRLIQTADAEFSVIESVMNQIAGQPNMHVATVVQIGANDGRQFDLIHKYITKYALCGVLVEPNPCTFKKLKENYADQPQLCFENVAIGDTAGAMTLYTFAPLEGLGQERSDLDLSVYASLDYQSINRTKRINKIKNEIQGQSVPVITMPMLIEKHQLRTVDVLAIDTEGYDLKILKGFDFEKCKPRVIVYEHCFSEADEEEYCLKRLIANGYKIHRGLGVDTVAVLFAE